MEKYSKWRVRMTEPTITVKVTDEDLIEILSKGVVELKEENIILKKELDDASKLLDGLTIPELLELVKSLNEENQALQRHIKRSTFNKIRVEDVFNCAKYDKFYDNEEAIKSIDWIAKEMGVDFE